MSQVEGAFGPQESETLISNLGNQFFGRTTNPKTAQRVTAIFGRQDVEYTSYSAGKGSSSAGSSSSTNASTSIQQRDRLEAQAVMRLEPGKFAGIIAEGNTNESVDRFHQPTVKAKPIKPFKTVTEEQKRFNFKQIKEELQSIVSTSAKPTDTQKPQEDHSNKKFDSQAHDPDWETFA
ncbi:TraG/TraD/VirD4 family protein [Nostoc sp. CHAB 5834]|nr:TraG/TraD/VirD4 family protein [Nostoc sp. CHAB 5834]